MKEKIIAAIYSAIDDFNSQFPDDRPIEKAPQTKLYGDGGVLDSLGLINIIVAVEAKIDELLDAQISLADEKALSQTQSPFKSVESLASYIQMILGSND